MYDGIPDRHHKCTEASLELLLIVIVGLWFLILITLQQHFRLSLSQSTEGPKQVRQLELYRARVRQHVEELTQMRKTMTPQEYRAARQAYFARHQNEHPNRYDAVRDATYEAECVEHCRVPKH